MKKTRAAALVAAFIGKVWSITAYNSPEEYMSILGGTKNLASNDVSYGNLLPEVTLPWGFNGWAPSTAGSSSGSWWFYSEAQTLYGIRCTKQPSPWIGDYGQFRFMAHIVAGGPGQSLDTAGPSNFAPYNPAESTWSPYHFKTSLLSYGAASGPTTLEVTPTMHGSVLRTSFAPFAGGSSSNLDSAYNQTRRLLVALEQPDSDELVANGLDEDAGGGLFSFQGTSTANSGGVPDGFGHYFYATVAGGSQGDVVVEPAAFEVRTDGGLLWLYLDFDPSATFPTQTKKRDSAASPPSRKQRSSPSSLRSVASPRGHGTGKGVGQVIGAGPRHSQGNLVGGELEEEKEGDVFVVRVATSLISYEQAKANYAAELLGDPSDISSGKKKAAAAAAEEAGYSGGAGVTFEDVLDAAKAQWIEQVGSRLVVQDVGAGYEDQEAEDAALTVFYSSVYRASKYPRQLWEEDPASGGPIHWSPYTGNVEEGVFSSDQGFWDAYRTTYSLLSLTRPDRFATMLEGWLNAWKEGGWVPQWSSPGYRGSMTGTMSDVTFSEAIVKLPHCGTPEGDDAGYCVNATELLTASLQNAFVAPGPDAHDEGRECLEEYAAYGYVPSDSSCGATVSRSLNYLHSDWALSRACLVTAAAAAAEGVPSVDLTAAVSSTERARKLVGLKAPVVSLEDAAGVLASRAANWSLLLNPETMFLAPKTSDGSFAATFDEFAWGDGVGYTEAGPWQYRLEIPYAPDSLQASLAELGVDASQVVEDANTIGSYFHAGSYGVPIHEQYEMAVNCWGQWEFNNQPVWALQHMQVAFGASEAGGVSGGSSAARAQAWIRKTLSDLFTPNADMFPGDEDNGSMAAWFLLNAIGLYPLSPASGDYVLGSPLFANVTLALGGFPGAGLSSTGESAVAATATLVVSAINQGPANVYVQAVSLNGQPIGTGIDNDGGDGGGVSVSYSDLMKGGVLEFTMGPEPASQL